MNGQSMSGEFEALPFSAGGMAGEWEAEGEWSGEQEGDGEFEEERGRSGGRMGGMGGRSGARPAYRGGGRPGRAPMGRPAPPGRPKPGPRPGRWPRGPYWGPVYGWPGGVMVAEPMGYPLPVRDGGGGGAPAFEPIELAATDDGDDAPPQEEMPGSLRSVLASMAEAAPRFRYVGRLNDVRNLNLPRRPGHYLITFRQGNAWKAYNGQTGNLHERLVKHRLGATVLGLPVSGHHVYIAESGRPEPARRTIEMSINRAMLRNHPGVLTNQNAELEMELLGWT
ncbi:hypothetical protein [Massilia sp. METH4]|uniref:hypothetical protein n=1 Tax=Massilia sp. METH4 TaxID=3123041 RepID=UPI0030D0C085